MRDDDEGVRRRTSMRACVHACVRVDVEGEAVVKDGRRRPASTCDRLETKETMVDERTDGVLPRIERKERTDETRAFFTSARIRSTSIDARDARRP